MAVGALEWRGTVLGVAHLRVIAAQHCEVSARYCQESSVLFIAGEQALTQKKKINSFSSYLDSLHSAIKERRGCAVRIEVHDIKLCRGVLMLTHNHTNSTTSLSTN